MGWMLLLLLAANVAFLGWQLHASTQPISPPPEPTVSRAATVNRLLLLSELAPGELRTRAPLSEVSAPASPAPSRARDGEATAVRTCFSVGPVQAGDEVTVMAKWFESKGGTPLLREDERRELALYWVFFPPLDTRDEAQARHREMREKGIEDISVIKRGDMANAVSLGVYSRKLSLDRRLTELRRHGYEPGVVPRYRQKKATWYDVQFNTAEFEFPTDQFSLTFPAAQVQEAACTSGPAALKASDLSDVSRGAGNAAKAVKERG